MNSTTIVAGVASLIIVAAFLAFVGGVAMLFYTSVRGFIQWVARTAYRAAKGRE